MNRLASYFVAAAIALVSSGCAGLNGNEIHVSENEKPNSDASTVKYQASIRIAGYTDGRNSTGNPRKIGVSEQRVFGLSGSEIVLDRDVADVVATSLRRRLEDTGIRVLAKDDASALFELSGVVKELKYDVKVRDHVFVKLETTLKEVATGKVIWAGEVEQKDDHFAGVSGNSKADIANSLKKEVGIATGKTAEAIDAVLMATHPELFGLTPGTKVIPGMKVLATPEVALPAAAVPASSMPAKNDQPQTDAANGVMVINTQPGRAKVYLDGVYFGMSPLRAEVVPGVYKVEVKLKGYRTASEKVSIRKGDSTELELALER